jgi:hypothetical protein
MNHMMSIARSAGQVCARYIAQLLLTSKVQGSIQQINSYTQPVDNLVQNTKLRLRHAQVIHMLDMAGTLTARAFKGSKRAASRIARLVAYVIGIALCLPMSHASSGSIDAIEPKQYIRIALPKKEALCLIKLYGKESAFNPYAIGNLNGTNQTYGIPQIKNPIIYDKTPKQQIDYGLKYIDHRYDGNACNAWSHWLRKGWH